VSIISAVGEKNEVWLFLKAALQNNDVKRTHEASSQTFVIEYSSGKTTDCTTNNFGQPMTLFRFSTTFLLQSYYFSVKHSYIHTHTYILSQVYNICINAEVYKGR
jgi:hypothetical protein